MTRGCPSQILSGLSCDLDWARDASWGLERCWLANGKSKAESLSGGQIRSFISRVYWNSCNQTWAKSIKKRFSFTFRLFFAQGFLKPFVKETNLKHLEPCWTYTVWTKAQLWSLHHRCLALLSGAQCQDGELGRGKPVATPHLPWEPHHRHHPCPSMSIHAHSCSWINVHPIWSCWAVYFRLRIYSRPHIYSYMLFSFVFNDLGFTAIFCFANLWPQSRLHSRWLGKQTVRLVDKGMTIDGAWAQVLIEDLCKVSSGVTHPCDPQPVIT